MPVMQREYYFSEAFRQQFMFINLVNMYKRMLTRACNNKIKLFYFFSSEFFWIPF